MTAKQYAEKCVSDGVMPSGIVMRGMGIAPEVVNYWRAKSREKLQKKWESWRLSPDEIEFAEAMFA